MAIHWQIPFVSLRSGTQYTVNVYDADYTGTPIVLKGGAEPFTTEEDGDDDPFAPIRTQSGKLRIVDDGFAADGTTPFNWKDFVPATAADRPVTLTHVSNSQTIVDWQGFIQTQDFSGTLYGNPQEREFPVYCALSLLEAQQPGNSDTEKHNFAWLIDYAATTAETLSGNAIGFDNFFIQGNVDAQKWLSKQFEMLNFFKETNDADGYITAQYNLYEIMEDAMKFWGWTMRSQGRTMFLTCYDDLSEPKFVSMTRAQLQTMAGGTHAGTNDVDFIGTTLTGDIFASTDNDDFKRRGPAKATVQSDCNEQETIVKFAPEAVRKELGDTWTWVSGSESLTGYFTTPTVSQFGQQATDPSYKILSGTSGANGGFCRRQIFPSAEQEKASKCDLILMHAFSSTTPCSQITIKKRCNYSGGSLSLKGSLYQGTKQFEAGDDSWFAFFRIGIGASYNTAKWFKLTCDANGHIFHEWTTSPQMLAVHINTNTLNGFAAYNLSGNIDWGNFASIPVDEGINGWMFVDFMGCHSYNGSNTTAEVADFEVNFSRDETFIVNNTTQQRPRVLSEDRVSSMEYTATNSNGTGEDWNADCIFASDNNMEYGYGLIIELSGKFMDTAQYGYDVSDIREEHPEQHLANRVAAFWATSKRQITTELQANAVPAITPQHKVTLDGTVFNLTAISRDWQNDVLILTLLEQRTE